MAAAALAAPFVGVCTRRESAYEEVIDLRYSWGESYGMLEELKAAEAEADFLHLPAHVEGLAMDDG